LALSGFQPLDAAAGSPVTVRLLTIGNSFSQNATKYLDDLAKADGNLLIHQGAVVGGCTLSQHWARVEILDRNPGETKALYSTGRSLRQMLAAEPWDYVTIQQASMISHNPATHQPWAGKLASLIRELAPSSELLVHQTWAYRCDDPRFTKPSGAPGEPATREAMYEGLTKAYEGTAAALGARVLPVGDAFHAVDSDPAMGFRPDAAFDPAAARHPALPDQTHSLHAGWFWRVSTNGPPRLAMDGHHAGLAGEYLAACVWYELMFRTSVVSNAFVPPKLDPQFARYLRETAHRVVAARQAARAASRPRILFDTDMLTDCDDAAALALLHAMADAGECEILATVVSVPDVNSAATVDAINRWYGRPDLPLGMVKGSGGVRPSRYVAGIASGFPNRVTSGFEVPDAVSTYRDVLDRQPDGSVTLVTVGYLTNLKGLLDLPAEGGDPSGIDLVRRKVRVWVCMGGNFVGDPPRDDLKLGNVNFQRDAAAAVGAITRWPTPVVFVGREIGSVPSGLEAGAVLARTPPESPVRRAYELYFGGVAKDRHVADPTTVLYAVRGTGHRWTMSPPGRMDIRSDASFVWVPAGEGAQSYLLRVPGSGEIIEREVGELLLRPPRRAVVAPGAPAS
jgi:hypothetical protein